MSIIKKGLRTGKIKIAVANKPLSLLFLFRDTFYKFAELSGWGIINRGSHEQACGLAGC